MEKRTGRLILAVIGGTAAALLAALIPAAVFWLFDQKSGYRQDPGLYRPDVIEVAYEGQTRVLKPGAKEYEQIFEKAQWCWDNSTVDRYSGLPLRVLLTHLDEKPEDTMEVTFRYKGEIEWQNLVANTYTFFPLAEEEGIESNLYISMDGNYLKRAVVVVFEPTAELTQLLLEAVEEKEGDP